MTDFFICIATILGTFAAMDVIEEAFRRHHQRRRAPRRRTR